MIIDDKKKQEILSLMKEGKINKILNDSQEEIICPLFCSKNLTTTSYTDHYIQCEANIQACKRCGTNYKKNDIHREITIHKNVTQRFTCMECMQGRMVRLYLIANHKNNCLGLQQKRNDKKLIDKTPQEIGNELTLLYN